MESGANKKMTEKRNRQSEKILKKTSCKENNKRQETKPKKPITKKPIIIINYLSSWRGAPLLA